MLGFAYLGLIPKHVVARQGTLKREKRSETAEKEIKGKYLSPHPDRTRPIDLGDLAKKQALVWLDIFINVEETKQKPTSSATGETGR